jgi:hypothetical protein
MKITAKVDPRLISVADAFFDSTPETIYRELLQNSRRAGATEVRIDRVGDRIVYEDNGPGCQPESLLGLGTSDWEGLVKERPAGVGFFSLANTEPVVSSPSDGWEMTLTRDHFRGEEVEVLPIPRTSGVGFRAVMKLDGFPTSSVTDYCGLQVVVGNDRRRSATPEQFLSFADTVGIPGRPTKIYEAGDKLGKCIEVPKGMRMAARVGTHNYSSSVSVLYGGYAVHHTLPSTEPGSVVIRIEVDSERVLPLTLPQRCKIIEGAEWLALLPAIRMMICHACAEAQRDIGRDPGWILTAREDYEGWIFPPKDPHVQVYNYDYHPSLPHTWKQGKSVSIRDLVERMLIQEAPWTLQYDRDLVALPIRRANVRDWLHDPRWARIPEYAELVRQVDLMVKNEASSVYLKIVQNGEEERIAVLNWDADREFDQIACLEKVDEIFLCWANCGDGRERSMRIDHACREDCGEIYGFFTQEGLEEIWHEWTRSFLELFCEGEVVHESAVDSITTELARLRGDATQMVVKQLHSRNWDVCNAIEYPVAVIYAPWEREQTTRSIDIGGEDLLKWLEIGIDHAGEDLRPKLEKIASVIKKRE